MVVLVHMDSDDMYAENFIEELKKIKPERGLVIFAEDGYMLDMESGRLFHFQPGEHGPGPYFAMCYTRASLLTGANWDKYREKFKLFKLHHELRSCPIKAKLPAGLFCGTIHGTNTSRTMKNPNTMKRVGAEITDEDKKEAILATFGQ